MVQEIKKIYEEVNRDEGGKVLEPNYIFLSAFLNLKVFKKHCESIGVEYFFEKPVSVSKLSELLNIL